MALYNLPQAQVIIGLITQSSTSAPVLTILENTIGAVPTMGYTGVGVYTLTLTGYLPEARTVVIMPPQGATSNAGSRASKASGNDNVIDITSFSSLSAGTAGNGVMTAQPIMILVF